MDLQHKLAEQIAVCMDGYSNEEEKQEEHILLVYGIELFLNEFLKILLIFIIALFMGEGKVAVFFMAYVIIARRVSGGKHFKSNFMCTIFTTFTCYIGPLLCKQSRLPIELQIVVIILEILGIFLLIPYEKEEREFTQKLRKKRKRQALFCFLISIPVAWLLGGTAFMNGLFLCEGIVLVSAIQKKSVRNIYSC